jgi:hypothetical protein
MALAVLKYARRATAPLIFVALMRGNIPRLRLSELLSGDCFGYKFHRKSEGRTIVISDAAMPRGVGPQGLVGCPLGRIFSRSPASRATSRANHAAARAGLLALRSLKHRFARRSLMRKAENAIATHLAMLMRLRFERVTWDEAGRVDAEAWADEVIYFIRNQIQPVLSASERQVLAEEHDRIAWLIADQIEAVARKSPSFYRFADRSAPA